ncbi:hypothetical protein DBR32_09440 [Taibaiella sp. KBW10]|uniref:T9SS type A sorting domain-containing protein n=1 Tax=Taibaiella sp. KBW10 TaxID=2153357 RepID=UPI000F59403D|nr:T9SS type A sorting domain-containing protein [Taibaiella sp. KBW10]RQO30924.1 hypothetical protein DBR32_09440 [Taibaiella sp. KBW10]
MKTIFTWRKPLMLTVLSVLLGIISTTAQGTYQLVTSSAQIVSGGQYLITDGKSGTVGAIGYQNTNNRPAVNVTVSSNAITTTVATLSSDEARPYEITLGTGTGGTFTLKDAVNNTFLRPRTGNNNGLLGNASPENFTISVTSSGIATITGPASYSRNILKYNVSADLFACYGSGQDDIYMFKLVNPPSVTTSKASLSGFSYGEGNGPSAAQTFTLSASDLTPASGNISISVPAGFEYSFNGTTYLSSQSVAYSGAALSSRTVYVRMKSELNSGNYANTLSISGGGMSKSIPLSGSVTNVPLPVTIKDIKAFKEKEGHTIVWTVADEKAIHHYELEASPDALHFEPVGTITAKGLEQYSLQRTAVWKGKNYYRLNILEADGTNSYSKIIMLAENATAEELIVYPNPCTDVITVQNLLPGEVFELWNLAGKQLKTVVATQPVMLLDMANLPAGTYLLILNRKEDNIRKMILKK